MKASMAISTNLPCIAAHADDGVLGHAIHGTTITQATCRITTSTKETFFSSQHYEKEQH